MARRNAVWEKATKEYSKLKTRTENIIAVHDGTKEKKKLPSIKDMTATEERMVISRMLKNYINAQDDGLSADQLIDKYRSELKELCKYDKDTVDVFGHVNTWWVFGEVANELNYEVFMAEADNVGYKRTTRGEKEMPNDLFSIEYAPDKLNTAAIKNHYADLESEIKETIKKEEEKKIKEKKPDKIAAIEKKINDLNCKLDSIKAELSVVEAFIGKYYNSGHLRDEYKERTDAELIGMFKDGILSPYQSTQIALHESTHQTILDYMREIVWD